MHETWGDVTSFFRIDRVQPMNIDLSIFLVVFDYTYEYFFQFLTSYGSDAEATRLLDTYDWYFLPVVNPDGYEYSWEGDRYWRKNTRLGALCDGVDLNRNFDQAWMSKYGLNTK